MRIRVRKNPKFLAGSESKKKYGFGYRYGFGSRHCILKVQHGSSVPDPGLGSFLSQGSVIRNNFFPDPGSESRILLHKNKISNEI
jgi:hypothetical protein